MVSASALFLMKGYNYSLALWRQSRLWRSAARCLLHYSTSILTDSQATVTASESESRWPLTSSAEACYIRMFKAVKGPYIWARRNTLTRTPMSCKARKLTRFNLVSWKLLCAVIGSFVYDDPRRQEHKQNTAIGRTWLVRLTICTIITSQILLALAIDIMWFLKK